MQQTFNMEQAKFTQSNLQNTVETMEAMKMANKQLKTKFKKIDIDKLEELQEEMKDMMQDADEIQEVLGRNYNVPDDINEEEIEAGNIIDKTKKLIELEALEEDALFGEGETELPSYLQNDKAKTENKVKAMQNEEIELDGYGLPKEPESNIGYNTIQHEDHKNTNII